METSLTIELWHLLVASAAGISVIILALQRIAGVKKGIETKATTEALWKQDMEKRVASLESQDQKLDNMLDKIYESVQKLKTDVIKEINRLEKEFIQKK